MITIWHVKALILDDCEAKQQAPGKIFQELASHVPAETRCLTQLTSIHQKKRKLNKRISWLIIYNMKLMWWCVDHQRKKGLYCKNVDVSLSCMQHYFSALKEKMISVCIEIVICSQRQRVMSHINHTNKRAEHKNAWLRAKLLHWRNKQQQMNK